MRSNSNPAARRKRCLASIAESIRRFEIEDDLLRTCSADADPLGLAAEAASELMRRYYADLPSIPDGAWVFPITDRDRAELRQHLKSATRSTECRAAAKSLADDICKHLPSDEAFGVAMAVFRYLDMRGRP